ncbi:MAG: hypothetical protein KGM47_07560 [Acidobacteriota bacterium]|nr:hypothetical protein [Acidobacteriota bacterium]
MSHVHRLQDANRIFFVTVNLRRALAPFGPGEYAKLIVAVEASLAKLEFKLLGYVLMPDHWRALQDVKWLSARALNQARGTSGAVWQHQFWDRFVRHRKEFTDRLAYMHMNPVRKGLVTKPEEWRWSSYNNYALDPIAVKRCVIAVDYVMLPETYRG